LHRQRHGLTKGQPFRLFLGEQACLEERHHSRQRESRRFRFFVIHSAVIPSVGVLRPDWPANSQKEFR
jgi:hypothetical protein